MTGPNVGTVSVKVTPDTSRFWAELKAKLAAIDDAITIPVKLDLDENGVRAKAKAITAGMAKQLEVDLNKAVGAVNAKGPRRFKLDIDNEFDYRLRQRLSKFKATVKVDVDVDRSGLQRFRDALTNMFSGAAGGAAGGGSSGFGKLGPFVDSLAVVAAVAAIAAPALALVTGALAALPAVVAGVATPIAVIALGLEGIKEAAKGLSAPLTDLKKSISSVFETRLTPVFDKLATVLPKLDAPLQLVAGGLSDIASSFVNTISEGPGLEKLQSTISNIAAALTTAAPGVGRLTDGLLGLAQGVTAKFPAVAGWINTTADSFANWVAKVAGDGSLDRAMGNFGETLKGVLDIFGDIAKQGFDWLQDPAFAQQMKSFVSDTQTLVNQVLPALGNIFGQISDALGPIVSILDRIDRFQPPPWMNLEGKAGKSVSLGRGLGADLDEVLPKLEVIDRKIKGFGGFPGMQKPEKPLFGAVGSWFDSLETAIGGKGEQVGKGLIDPSFGEGIRSGIVDIFKNLNMGSILGVAEGPLKGLWDNLGIGMASASAETGTKAGQTLGTKLGEGFQTANAAGGITTQVQTLGPQIQAALQGALAQLQTIPAQIQQAFAGVGAAVTGSMATVVGAVTNAGSQIVASFTGSLSQIPGVATNTFAAVAAAAAAGMANVVTAITSGAAQCVAAVTNMGTQIVAALQSAASGAQAAGAAVGQGMAAGIRSGIGAAVAAARDLAAQVTAASQVKLGIKSPSKVFTEIGAQTAQGLQDGLEGGFAGVIARATELSGKLTEAVNGGLGGVDGKALTDGIKQQLAELELQRKQLKVDKDAIPKEDKEKRAGVQGQIDQIQAIKDQLALQKDQLGFSQQYGDELDSHKDSVTQANNIITESIASMIDGIKGFAMANVNQFASDLGISGEGAIPQIANIGLDWATSTLSNLVSSPFQQGGGTNITVNSVDDALAAKQTIDNKKALQFAGR